MLFKYNSEAEFLTFLQSCLLKHNYFNNDKIKIHFSNSRPNTLQVSMRSMKTTSDVFCNTNVQIGTLDVLSPNISDKIPTGTPV